MYALVYTAAQLLFLLRAARQTPVTPNAKLRPFSIALNILLLLLLPFAAFCFLFGMAGDGVHPALPPAERVLYTAIAQLGLSAAPTVLLSFVHSILLRRNGYTARSIAVQFLPVLHTMLLLILAAL